MLNILAQVSQKDKAGFVEKFKQIWLQPDRESAIHYAHKLIAYYEARYPEAMSVLDEGLEDSLQCSAFPEINARKIALTNSLERYFQALIRISDCSARTLWNTKRIGRQDDIIFQRLRLQNSGLCSLRQHKGRKAPMTSLQPNREHHLTQYNSMIKNAIDNTRVIFWSKK